MNKLLILLPAVLVTYAVFSVPHNTSFIAGIAGLFIVASVWIFALGLIFDPQTDEGSIA